MALVRIWDSSYGDRPTSLPVPVSTNTGFPGAPSVTSAIAAFVNVVSSDPGASQDSTQGYTPGSIVFNNTAGQLRTWICRDNTAGAAKWVFEGADYTNGGSNPASEVTQFGGSSSALMGEEGNINRQISSAGVQLFGTTGADVILALYTLPASAFDVLGRGLNILATGSLTAGTVPLKTIKLYWNPTSPASLVVGGSIGGGSVIASVIAGNVSGGGWQIEANVFKYGGAGSNTQIALHQASQAGNTVGALLSPTLLTTAENQPIPIAVTGNSILASGDITFSFLEVNAMN
jgi:hypothetical protein